MVRRIGLLLFLTVGCGSEPPVAPAPVPEPGPVEEAVVAPPPPTPTPARPALPIIRVRPEDEDAIDAAVHAALESGAAPGCVVAIGRSDGIVFRRAYGRRAVDPEPERMTVDTIFDLASITKAVATTTSLMVLVERGDVELDAPAARYLPGIDRRVTLRHLLLHTSGLPAVDLLRAYGDDRARDVERIARTTLEHPPGTHFRYSDLGFILLGEIVARASERSLPEFATETLFAPLGMDDTFFSPPEHTHPRIAPTERAERRGGVMIRGVVHDPRAYRLGGVAGNAGLFSTIGDLSRFARMLLARGELDGARVLRAETVREMTRPYPRPGRGSRALGWDTERAGLGAAAFGHGGYTGTSFWVDPENDLYVILLSNRVHPTGDGNVSGLVRALGPLAREAASHAAPLRPGPVSAGVDVLERDDFATLRGARVALLTHRAARTRDGRRTLDVLHASREVTIVRVLAPEHGLLSDREGQIENGADTRTGLPVLGLFGRTRTPTDEMLEGIDTIVVDLQDVGVRFYTYGSTVRRVLEAAAERELRVVVLDRPDPLGGEDVRGPLVEPEFESFINHHALPVVHGMTLGELATLLNAERGIDATLEVIELEGWRRDMSWSQSGLRWVPPSPNLRSPDATTLYPMLGLLEGTNVSVGRGTDAPFSQIGAPFIDGDAFVEALGSIAGVEITADRFIPRAARHRGVPCEGARFTITDADALEPVRAAIHIASTLHRLYPDAWEPERMIRAMAHRGVHEAMLEGESIDLLERRWSADLEAFETVRARYLRY